jgi:hypothetical protein
MKAICFGVYIYMWKSILIRTGKGGGGSRNREKITGIPVHKAGSKVYNSDKHLPQSPFTGNFFDEDNLLWRLYS